MKTLLPWLGGAGVVILTGIGLLIWIVSGNTSNTASSTEDVGSGFVSAPTQTIGSGSSNNSSGEPNGLQTITQGSSASKVFKIADGPVAGATFVQTLNPTTTLARFALQGNGHVQDQPIDVAGSLPRAVSNTTIPGIAKVLWGAKGSVAYLQYIDGSTIKTLSLKFPATTTRVTTQTTQIQFLPDNITTLSPSPDGTRVAYLLSSTDGSVGYSAKYDGSEAKKLFSLPMSQLLLSWPAAAALLLQTKSAAFVPGMLFSVNSSTGSVVPVLSASGLTATANAASSYVVYQTSTPGGTTRLSYVHDNAKNADAALSFDPIPEKCAWSFVSAAVMYCAVPDQYTDASYLDLWHQGAASVADAIMRFDVSDNISDTIATPGVDGGVASDIAEIAVSPDEKYLLFIKKGDRSLWGVRLTR
jgi:hypothetical protein